MQKTHQLTAKRGRPNRPLPIGVHATGPKAGKPKTCHIRTGSTRHLTADEAGQLGDFLAANGIEGDYRLGPVAPKPSTRRGAKGKRKLGTKQKAVAAKSDDEVFKGSALGDFDSLADVDAVEPPE